MTDTTVGAKPRTLFPILTLDELRDRPRPKALIDGILYANTLAEVYGAPGTFKSFIALSWALEIASGDDPQRVIYVAAEGESGITDRVDAWRIRNGDEIDPKYFQVVPQPIQFNKADMIGFLDSIRETGPDPVLIVFDTRARCTVGLEENSARDMGEAIEAIDGLRKATGATVLTVHHSGKAGGSSRGSSAWSGAMWSELEVKRRSKDFAATVSACKHKEAADGGAVAYRLEIGSNSLVAVPALDGSAVDQIFHDISKDGMLRSELVALLRAEGISNGRAYDLVKQRTMDDKSNSRRVLPLA